jgi:hypothetical protein
MIRKHVRDHAMTLALIRTDRAPTELDSLLKSAGRACSLPLSRRLSSPVSDFGFAELNSDKRKLIVLWVGGAKTELVSVSETDEVSIRDLEDGIVSTNFFSGTLSNGT